MKKKLYHALGMALTKGGEAEALDALATLRVLKRANLLLIKADVAWFSSMVDEMIKRIPSRAIKVSASETVEVLVSYVQRS